VLENRGFGSGSGGSEEETGDGQQLEMEGATNGFLQPQPPLHPGCALYFHHYCRHASQNFHRSVHDFWLFPLLSHFCSLCARQGGPRWLPGWSVRRGGEMCTPVERR